MGNAPDDDPGHQVVLVVVAQVAEEVGGGAHPGQGIDLDCMQVQVVADDVADCLGISGGARAAAVDPVMDRADLVADSVRHVAAGGGAAVGRHHHAAVVLHGHDGRLRGGQRKITSQSEVSSGPHEDRSEFSRLRTEQEDPARSLRTGQTKPGTEEQNTSTIQKR